MEQKYKEKPEHDEIFMRRCLFLATRGKGFVSPNPLVGSVIVRNGKIIGEGYHRQYGGPHAEVHAIESVKDPSLLKDATLYVNLEPCSHWGKTPPCADLIIKKQIPRVVIGTIDPFAKVCGNGIARLKEAGIDVTVGVLEKEAEFLNRRFFTFHRKHRPYIILKWAETLDGYIDTNRTNPENETPPWITNDHARILVHRWRAEEDGILIGAKTAIMDNPQLNLRHYAGKEPFKIVIDTHGVLPKNLNIFTNNTLTIVFTPNPENFIGYPCKVYGETAPEKIVGTLYELNIQSVIVEGGTKTLQQFIEKNLFDEIRRFIGPITFGNGVPAPKLDQKADRNIKIGDCILSFYFNQPNDLFDDLI